MNLQYALDTLKRRHSAHARKITVAFAKEDLDTAALFTIRLNELRYAIEVLEAALEDSK